MSINSKKRRDAKKKKQKGKSRQSEIVSTGFMKKMSREHLDILQNIEMTIVSCDREDSTVDDEKAANALRYFLYDKQTEEASTLQIIKKLKDIRDIRSDLSDKDWNNGLRVVLDSIHTHSTLTKGSRGYLDFVSDYLPKTKDNKPILFIGDMNADSYEDDSEDISEIFDDGFMDDDESQYLDDEDEFMDEDEEDIEEEEEDVVYYEDMEDEEVNTKNSAKVDSSFASILTKIKSFLGNTDKSHGPAE